RDRTAEGGRGDHGRTALLCGRLRRRRIDVELIARTERDGTLVAVARRRDSEYLAAVRHNGPGLGLADEVALAEFHAQLDQRCQVRAGLSPFREEMGADPAPEGHKRLDERLLGVVEPDAAHDVAIDLDDRRAQRGDERERRITGTRVVDREPETELAQLADLALQWYDVGDRLLLRALQRDGLWREAVLRDEV